MALFCLIVLRKVSVDVSQVVVTSCNINMFFIDKLCPDDWHRRTGTFGLGRGGRWLFCPKKLRNARKRELYTSTQIAVKTFPILRSNETIPKTQRNSDFWNFRGKRKLVLKNRIFREIWGKITAFDWRRETTFGSSYREDRKNEGSGNRDSSVTYWSYFETSHIPSLWLQSTAW